MGLVRKSIFLHFFSFMLFVIFITYRELDSYLNHVVDYRISESDLEKRISSLEYEKVLLKNQIDDFEYETYLAQTSPKHQGRSIASIPLKSELDVDFSGALVGSLRKASKENKLDTFQKQMALLMLHYPQSKHIQEAKFLEINILVRNKKTSKALQQIQFMIQQFPDSIFTGYSLLKMAEILNESQQINESREIYQLISEHYAFEKPLRDEALSKLKQE